MEYNVKSGKRIATIDLDGTECAVKFGSTYNVFEVRNNGSAPVLMALNSGAAEGDDGAVSVPAGGSFCYPHMQQLDTVYLTGSGKVIVLAKNDTNPSFKSAPANGQGGGGTEKYIFSKTEPMFGFIANALYNSGYDRCEYNSNELVIFKSYTGYNLTHSYAVDFTNIKKIIIKGATESNLNNLTATAFCYIAPAVVTSLDENVWNEINQSVGTTSSEFSAEIDCTGILGENYIHLAILHGKETNSNTSYLYIDSITFVYG